MNADQREWTWRMLQSVPLTHQRCEAIADLMDELRSARMVLTSQVTAEIRHGERPVMILRFTARPMTEKQAKELGIEARQ
ncbi:hypothetical protein [Actinomyces timonensis]|uniref:hypothetical protein n=1 Tax=Actinomyces timonensis TaxID=1288391 RepID=UPI00031E0A9F|nr:hypothetical protein [Actinomyces timonensis]